MTDLIDRLLFLARNIVREEYWIDEEKEEFESIKAQLKQEHEMCAWMEQYEIKSMTELCQVFLGFGDVKRDKEIVKRLDDEIIRWYKFDDKDTFKTSVSGIKNMLKSIIGNEK